MMEGEKFINLFFFLLEAVTGFGFEVFLPYAEGITIYFRQRLDIPESKVYHVYTIQNRTVFHMPYVSKKAKNIMKHLLKGVFEDCIEEIR